MATILGTFDDLAGAQGAQEKLLQSGIARERMHLEPSVDAGFLRRAGPATPEPTDANYRHPGVLESIGQMFADLFESHTTEPGIYAASLKPGSSLLLVGALDAEEGDRVRTLLEECGASQVQSRGNAADLSSGGIAAPVPDSVRLDIGSGDRSPVPTRESAMASDRDRPASDSINREREPGHGG